MLTKYHHLIRRGWQRVETQYSRAIRGRNTVINQQRWMQTQPPTNSVKTTTWDSFRSSINPSTARSLWGAIWGIISAGAIAGIGLMIQRYMKGAEELMDQTLQDRLPDTKLARDVRIIKNKLAQRFTYESVSMIRAAQLDKDGVVLPSIFLDRTCDGMDDVIASLRTRQPVSFALIGLPNIGKTITLARSLVDLDNVIWIELNGEKKLLNTLMCETLGLDAGRDWVVPLKETVRQTTMRVIVVLDDIGIGLRTCPDMTEAIAKLMNLRDHGFISLAMISSTPLDWDKAEIAGKSRIESVTITPHRGLVDEMAEKLEWNAMLGKPLCAALKVLLVPNLGELVKICRITRGLKESMEWGRVDGQQNDVMDKLKTTLQDKVRQCVIDMVKSANTKLDKVLKAKDAGREHELLVKMLESCDGILHVNSSNDVYEETSLVVEGLVHRHHENTTVSYSFPNIAVEVAARTSTVVALTNSRAREQLDALKVIGWALADVKM